MSAQAFHLSDIQILDTEPRIFDLRLGVGLGFADVHKIRDLIKRNIAELRQHGEVSATVAEIKTPSETNAKGAGRPSTAYYLNEAQALLIAMFSRTERAAEVRRQLIEVFMAWRRGQLVAPGVDTRFDDLSLQERRLNLDLVREARVTFGPQRAALLWNRLGLPVVEHLPKADGREPQRCLSLLLETPLPFEGEPTIGDMIFQAWEWKPTCELLRQYGIRIMFDPDGIVISNTNKFVLSAFDASPFSNRRWIRLLRQLPGVVPMLARYDGEQTRGTFIPADLLDIARPDA